MREFSQNPEFENLVKQTIGDQQTTVIDEKSNVTSMNESAKNRDFFQDNNPIKKNVKPYRTTWIKSRNLLSNISYVGITKESFYDENFVFDVYALVAKSFLVGRKSWWPKQARNYLHALERMHVWRILQTCLSGRKFCIFKWRKSALYKIVRISLELYQKWW